MPDREKVIKGLTAIEDEAYDRWVHQQYIEDPLVTLIKENISDALALLREQEPVKPVCTEYDKAIVLFSCRDCKTQLLYGQRYCHMCGKAVKWE